MTKSTSGTFLQSLKRFWPKHDIKKAPKPTNNKSTSSKFLAIDINSDTCSFLKLKGKSPNYTLTDISILVLPKPCIREGKLTEISSVQQTLQKLLTHHPIKQKKSSLAISGALVINKEIKIKKNLSEHQIETKARHEAQKLFSKDIDELYVDYTRNDTTDDHHNLNIVATHKSDLEPYLTLLKKAHLTAKNIDIDYYALERVYPLLKEQLKGLPAENHVAVFYLTTDYFLMNVFHNDEFIYSHRYKFHHDSILDVIRDIIEEKEDGQTISDEDKKSIAKNISHLLQFFYSEHKSTTIDMIILTGPVAVIPSLTQTIAVATHVNTSIVNPFKNIKNQSSFNPQKLAQIAPAFLLNLAMAIKE